MRGHRAKIEKDGTSSTPFTARCQETGCDWASKPSHSRPVAQVHVRAHKQDTGERQ